MRALLCGLLATTACTGFIEGPGASTGATGAGGGVGEALTPVYPLAGIRRLSQAEAQQAASQLLGVPGPQVATALGTDDRQAGYTRNGDQRVSAVQADALWQGAADLAHQAVTQRLSALAPCSNAAGSEACAATFIHQLAPKAFRRTTTASEEAALLDVYRAGQAGATYAAGVELVITAVLQSASFLYVTELGPAAGGATVRLTGEEVATSLALLFTGLPPDAALLAQGRAGQLDSADGREAAARALLAGAPARAQVERLLLEWLAADAVDTAAKDATVFPQWLTVRGDVLTEARGIIDAAIFDGDGRLQTVLSTDRTQLSPALATFWGEGSVAATTQPAYRRGLLLSGAFTAANAHPATTSPVKRGALVRRRLLCQELPLPTNVGLIVVPPPDPTLTTRERFAAHSASPACAGCHSQLDPIGFALESFDAAGRYRTTENGKPIDPSGTLVGAGDATGAFTDAVGLAALLAPSKDVGACFQRQLYRFASGRNGGDEEATFVNFVKARPSAATGDVRGLLVDYARSDTFIVRRTQ